MNYVIIEWEGHPHCAAIHVHTCCMGCWNIHCTVVKSLKQSYFVYTLDSSGGSRDFHKGGQLTAEEVVGFSDSLNYYFCYLKRGEGGWLENPLNPSLYSECAMAWYAHWCGILHVITQIWFAQLWHSQLRNSYFNITTFFLPLFNVLLVCIFQFTIKIIQLHLQ